jgi:hypothetical protein
MKAILKNGVIYPKEKVPQDWPDGAELRVERSEPPSADKSDEFDRWMADVQASANLADAEDEQILETAIRDQRQQARDLARREAEKA